MSDVHMYHCGHILCSSYFELRLDAVVEIKRILQVS